MEFTSCDIIFIAILDRFVRQKVLVVCFDSSIESMRDILSFGVVIVREAQAAKDTSAAVEHQHTIQISSSGSSSINNSNNDKSNYTVCALLT